jgi:hypothetical protein
MAQIPPSCLHLRHCTALGLVPEKGDPVCRIAFFIRLNLTSPLPKVMNAKSLIPLP